MNKWTTLKKEERYQGKIFRYFCVERESPDTGERGVFDVLSTADWVCVVAIDKNKNFLLVQQYRQGRNEITLEFPGGAKGKEEGALLAAKRELLEETGHVSESWSFLGKVLPNPAFMDNVCYVYLAAECRETAPLNLDPLEEIELVKISKRDLELGIREHRVNHSLLLSALHLFGLYQLSRPGGESIAT